MLTVVDRFSKTARFIPLPKLPAAKETALAVFDHVFRVHGLPTDIVSDRGPQFVSQFWREFCRQIGATVSLSSGFHPQTNGQAERVNQILVVCSVLWLHTTPHPGVSSWVGPNTPIIRCRRHPPGYLRFTVVLVTSRLYFPRKNRRAPSPLSKPLLSAASLPGRGYGRHYVNLENASVGPPIATVLKPLDIFVARECGCPLVSYPFDLRRVS